MSVREDASLSALLSALSVTSLTLSRVVPFDAAASLLCGLLKSLDAFEGSITIFRVMCNQVSLSQSEARSGEAFIQAGLLLIWNGSNQRIGAKASRLEIVRSARSAI